VELTIIFQVKLGCMIFFLNSKLIMAHHFDVRILGFFWVSLQETRMCCGGGVVIFLMGNACLYCDSCMSKYAVYSSALPPL